MLDLSLRTGFEIRTCQPYRAKGKVESGVKYVRRNLWPSVRFTSVDSCLRASQQVRLSRPLGPESPVVPLSARLWLFVSPEVNGGGMLGHWGVDVQIQCPFKWPAKIVDVKHQVPFKRFFGLTRYPGMVKIVFAEGSTHENGAYNVYQRLHQRCWPHQLRGIHQLKERFPEHEGLAQWSQQAGEVYDQALAYPGPDPRLPETAQQFLKVKQQQRFQEQLWSLCQLYLGRDTSMRILCQRVEGFLPELFTFIVEPRAAADNNPA